MLILNPEKVRFGQSVIDNVTLISLDRAASRLVEEWDDLGPHCVLVDVPEQRLTIKLIHEIGPPAAAAPLPGQLDTLAFSVAPTRSDAATRRYSLAAVVTSIRHELSSRNGALRTIELRAVSTQGNSDPVTVT